MNRGFTLIEVMVVMLIVGVMATTLSLSLTPDSHRLLEDEAYRVARILEQAVDASETGDALALEWRADGWAFYRRQLDGQWLEVREGILAGHAWPQGIHAGIVRQPGTPPPWLLWQDNRSPPLAVSLHGGTRRLDLLLSPLGRVSVSEVK